MSRPLIATFTAGSVTSSVSFPVVLDNIVEPTNETFNVALTVPPTPSIRAGNRRVATVTIIDSTGIMIVGLFAVYVIFTTTCF